MVTASHNPKEDNGYVKSLSRFFAGLEFLNERIASRTLPLWCWSFSQLADSACGNFTVQGTVGSLVLCERVVL